MSEAQSVAWLVGWLAWAVIWALAIRLGVAWIARRRFGVRPFPAALIAYATMIVIIVASAALHGWVLGPVQLYGATPREAFSLEAYLAAPFGLPLVVGGWLVLLADFAWDVVRFVVSHFNKSART
ncbi:hypothetical protein [Phenylobacterium sp.]|uniref:hypothetical protein n=1 Tax=Phenylobacterium sp. TaxID=1871053 RepID=UPI003562D778